MKRPTKLIICMISLIFTIYTLELVSLSWWMMLIITGGISTLLFVMDFLNLSQDGVEISYELISVFASIGWISIFSNLIIDFISFMAFYFSIDKVILASILLSAGNTIGDLFANAALAKKGEPVMGAFASYSGQTFNNFIGFSANIFSSTKGGDSSFDLFGFNNDNGMMIKNYFLICVILTVVLLIIF